MSSPMGNTIGAAEAADILGVSRATVLRWAADETLRSQKMPGETGAYLFERSDVEELRDDLAAEEANA